MKADSARVVVILDRSGSMESVRESTVSGFNAFIEEQRKDKGQVVVTLVQFDDKIEEVYTLPLDQVPELNQSTFVPRGRTALLDAQGMTITRIGKSLAALPESERPEKVIVMTLTDGAENASEAYTLAQIAAMIKLQRDTYGWDFVFLGANQDAVSVAASMNIPSGSALSYAPSPQGMQATFNAVASRVRSSRQNQAKDFSDDDRSKSMGGQ